MPRAKVDPGVQIIRLFMALPVGEGALLLKHLAAVVEGRLRKVANGEVVKRVRKPKPPTMMEAADAFATPRKAISPRPRTAKPLVPPTPVAE